MKRKIALLLAVLIMFGTALPAYAEQSPEPGATATPEPEVTVTPEPEATAAPEPEVTETPEPVVTDTPAPAATETPTPEATATAEPAATDIPVPEVTETPEPVATAEPTAEPAPTATPEATAEPALPMQSAPSFTVALGEQSQTLTVGEEGAACRFENLSEGEYTLTVTGDGFAKYTQSIHVGLSDGILVQLTAGRLAGYDSGAHPGVLQIGDVNGDMIVDAADRSAMMRSVAGEDYAPFADLNRDGAIDLADAEYLAKGIAVGQLDPALTQATVERYVPASAIQTEVGGSVSGDMGDLLKDNGQAVQFGTADGGRISYEDPVTVSFGVSAGAHTDAILLEQTNIASGEILITYTDEMGVEHLAKGVIGEPAPATAAPAAPAEIVTEPVPDMGGPEIFAPVAVEPAMDGPEIIQAEPSAVPEPAVSEQAPQAEEAQSAGPEIIDTAPVDVPEDTATIDGMAVPFGRLPMRRLLRMANGAPAAPVVTETVEVVQDASGNFTVKLGGQKAVKKVTLTITGTTGGEDLASISQVEFVNGMEERIPEPALDDPQGVGAAAGSRQFTVSWNECVNVTGYEVEITAGGVTEYVPVAGRTLTVTNFNRDEVRNLTTYQVRVRSLNGSWKSSWSAAVSVTPMPNSAPDKPDNVKAVGGYQSVSVSWKNMKDTASYKLFYKRQDSADYTLIPDITGTSYTITGLDSSMATVYEVYVVGVNAKGDSAPSNHASAATVTLSPPDMPRFNLINRDASGRPGSAHIQSAVQYKGTMASSPADAAGGTAWGTVDGNPASYYDRRTWDDGGYNNLGGDIGLIYSFDRAYKIDTIGMMSAVDAGMDYTYIKLRWWDSAGTEHYIDRSEMYSERRTDGEGKAYFFLRLPQPVEATKIQIGTARYWAGNNRINVSEVYFYKYDELKQLLRDLYADDLHTVLADGVTIELLDELQARIEASVDEFGEVNPDKAMLLRELDTARQIYNDQFLGQVTKIHSGITASGDEHGFGGLNSWQPLGVTAAAGESITVYVGHSTKKTGSSTNLQLVATQYHAEAGSMSKVIATLKVGANEIKLPKIWTTTGVESGGALYVQYTGGAGAGDDYAVRVSGGTAVPVLDLYKVTDAAERSARVTAYLAELGAYVANIPSVHASVHQGEGSVSREVAYDYNERSCILGATDIMLDTMMLSLPAQQVLSGCGGSAQTLLNSLDAMERMMALFYQHKGLNASAPNPVDRIPSRHLNIRYQQMFSGAFMYASGDHIGIEWPETAGMVNCSGVVYDGSGIYQSGNYFGWGIAHEIGHDINQGSYAIAEITNNYFAVLAQAQDTNESVRFEYPKVYEKVTSGAKGSAGNVFTQLGMYWQLHLAYDKGFNFKTYSSYEEQLANLFFARVDTYARTPSSAPAPGGVALTLTGADTDQTLMRLCCAAAGKDILDFFQRWGKTPDETTVAYASQFEKETRAIYYVCDDSRRYALTHEGGGSLSADGTTAAVGAVTVTADPNMANHVKIAIAPGGVVSDEQVL